jgi:phosphoesterase RecJ-like protein
LQTPLVDLIRARQSFLLTGHENPDGDCLGAEVALYHLLTALGKRAAIVNPDPLARGFDFLLRHTPVGHAVADTPLPPFEVAVLLDCNQLSRLGALGPRLRSSGATIAVVDHHVGSEAGDGTVHYVDSKAAATGALVRRLYREFGVPLSEAAAEGVFLSLVMDTGWFRYSNTDHEVLSMAAELVAAGVDVSGLYDRLFRRLHPDAAAILGEALRRHELRLRGALAITCLDRALMERAAHTGFDTDLVIDPLRSLEGVEVVAVLKERFDGMVKLSLRAKRDVDVQRIAATWGGGGHKKAAGATMPGPLAAAAAALTARVELALASGVQEPA